MRRIKLFFLIFLIIETFIVLNYAFASNVNEVIVKEEQNNNIDIFNDISAPNLLLAETNTEKILYERNADIKIYPASLTKLMTAILVVENCELDEIVTVSEKAVNSVPLGYVNANLQVGEQLTVEDLMYAMLVPSANDAANALAEHVGGSIESFSTMMNTRAKELGCTGSNFTNPSGLHEENHYTTTRDLFLISKQAISNSFIKKVVGTTSYTLQNTEKYNKEPRVFTTTNYMKRNSLTKFYCDYCIGGKTGYTGEAKNCVVEFAKKDGIELIAIVMGEDAKVKGQKFLDAKEMFEYIYNNYENKVVVKEKDVYKNMKIPNATKETNELEIIYKDNINILERKDINLDSLEKNVKYTKISAPINKGETIGTITYTYNGIEYTTDLIANENVEESKVFSQVIKIILIILIIYIIYILLKSNKKNGKHGKKYLKRKKR